MLDPATVQRRIGHAIRAAVERGAVDAETGEWLRVCSLYATGEWSKDHDATWMDDAKLVAYDLDNWLGDEALTV